jgi:hypothetical protein
LNLPIVLVSTITSPLDSEFHHAFAPTASMTFPHSVPTPTRALAAPKRQRSKITCTHTRDAEGRSHCIKAGMIVGSRLRLGNAPSGSASLRAVQLGVVGGCKDWCAHGCIRPHHSWNHGLLLTPVRGLQVQLYPPWGTM